MLPTLTRFRLSDLNITQPQAGNMKKKRAESLAATNRHPSYPQFILILQMWQLSPEQSVYLIWVALGALLQMNGVLLNQLVENNFWNCAVLLLQICVRTAERCWMSVGLELCRYDWFLYTPSWDYIPNEMGFWWEVFLHSSTSGQRPTWNSYVFILW